MKTYELDVRVDLASVYGWFLNRQNRRNTLFKESAELEKWEDFGIYGVLGSSGFALPTENMIILGLKHTGLLECLGVQGYRVKRWSKNGCIIALEMEKEGRVHKKEVNASSYTPYWENGYSEREQMAMRRMKKFFSSTAYVEMEDRMCMTGFPSD